MNNSFSEQTNNTAIQPRLAQIPADGFRWTYKDAPITYGANAYKSEKNGGLGYTTFEQILKIAINPPSVPKFNPALNQTGNGWFILNKLITRDNAELRDGGLYYGITVDIDRHVTLDRIIEQLGPLNYLIYSTVSATVEHQKWRLIVPFEHPVTPLFWLGTIIAFNKRLGLTIISPDRCMESFNQISFMPNRGQYYESYFNNTSVFLEPESAYIQTDNKNLTQEQRAGLDADSLICWYNSQANLFADLARRFKQIGDKFITHESTSNIPGILVKWNEDNRRDEWLSYNILPPSMEGLGKRSGGGQLDRFGDAFDLFLFFECRNDMRLAMKRVADMKFAHIEKDVDVSELLANLRERVDTINAVEAGTEIVPWTMEMPVELFHDISCDKKGNITRIKPTSINLAILLKAYGVTVGYNEVNNENYILMPKEITDSNPVDCALEREVFYNNLYDICTRNNIPKSAVDDHAVGLMMSNVTNPLIEWFESVPWDGVDRLPEFCATLKVAEDLAPLRDDLLKKWLIQAVAAADMGRIGGRLNRDAVRKYELVLVLQGAQGAKKTTWFSNLLPRFVDGKEFSRRFIKTGVTLDQKDKDTLIKASRYWICELGEIDHTFKRSEISWLKGYLSEEEDVVRLPYGRAQLRFPRSTVFCGSVNDEAFLADATGSRRFLTIAVNFTSAHKPTFDLQQLWAQVWASYKKGADWWLSHAEEIALHVSNEAHQLVDPLEESISTAYNWSEQDLSLWQYESATQICEHALRDKRSVNKVKAVLAKREIYQEYGNFNNSSQRLYKMPPRVLCPL